MKSAPLWALLGTIFCMASYTNDAMACGNAITKASVFTAQEAFDMRDYKTTIRHLNNAYSGEDWTADKKITLYFNPKYRRTHGKMRRGMWLLAMSVVRSHATFHYSSSKRDVDTFEEKQELLAWSTRVLTLAVAHDPKQTRLSAYLAEAKALHSDNTSQDAAFDTLGELFKEDLLPDAVSLAALIALKKDKEMDYQDELARCVAMDAELACDGMSLDLTKPAFAVAPN